MKLHTTTTDVPLQHSFPFSSHGSQMLDLHFQLGLKFLGPNVVTPHGDSSSGAVSAGCICKHCTAMAGKQHAAVLLCAQVFLLAFSLPQLLTPFT